MKKIILAALTVATSLTLAACASNSTQNADNWATYEKEKSITIGFDETFVPMGFKDKSGQYMGFDIDLATAVFDEYGIAINWQPINWDLKETELNNGKIDLIWNGYTMTKERAEKVLFTTPYMANEQVLVTKKSSGIENFAGMADKVLAAQSGSSGYHALSEKPEVLKDLITDKEAVQYETFTQALIDLKADRVDGVLIDRVYANYYLQEEGELANYNIIASEFDGENFAVGARQADKTLVDNINAAFKGLYASGDFQKISDKWFGEDVGTDDLKN